MTLIFSLILLFFSSLEVIFPEGISSYDVEKHFWITLNSYLKISWWLWKLTANLHFFSLRKKN